ncbi:MAG: two-component system, NtrC family, sensor kinase [Blastocatellia bacterium]|jgi:two-component system NtrC family sensor kinase|nr:two-component system, NtrC family, sensor kinase [Blastocatellia bacterium]
MTNQPTDSGDERAATMDETTRRIAEPRGALVDRRESAATLDTVAEMVRRTLRSDTTSVASISLTDQTITWKAMSGFRTRPGPHEELTIPMRGRLAERAGSNGIMILSGIGASDEFPASDFPLHSAEGVVDLALVPLGARDENPGALAVGYRAPHTFTEEEQQLLTALAELAALAMENARLLETVSTAKKVWEQTFDAIPDGIIVHDRQMRVVRCNAHAAMMMDLLPAQVVGLSCADAFARLFGERAAAYHMGQGIGVASSFELQAEDGRRYLVSVAPITSLEHGIADQSLPSSSQNAEPPRAQTSDAQTYWSVITWSDVTELSEMQEQLSRSRRLATVGQLAAGVAHEINNPLAAINTCAEAVVRDLRETPETLALAESRDWNYYLEEIIRQVFRCKEITRGLLDLSRQRRPRRLASDLNSLVAEAARLTEQRVESEAVRLVVKLDENVGEVATDEGMVRQVLDNLLSNALDAVGQSGQITVSTLRAGERIAIEVADTGHGIAPELLVRIFDPFFTTKDPGKGSGLGLAICYTLAEALGGALTVESKPATGSRFRLWLPRRAPE